MKFLEHFGLKNPGDLPPLPSSALRDAAEEDGSAPVPIRR